jgi:hypothetical protein
MARCPDCNKFVSLDSSQDPEVTVDVDETGEVTCAFQIANACEQCGTEMYTAEFDTSVNADAIVRVEDSMTLADWLKRCQEFKATGALAEDEDDDIDLEVDEGDLERTSRTEGKLQPFDHELRSPVEYDVNWECGYESVDTQRSSRTEGKGRGTRTFYGARVGFTVKVTFRGATSEFEGSVEDDIQASSMDQQF